MPTQDSHKPFVTFDFRRSVATSTWIRWYRIMAFAEAASWALLLVGMYFKYLAPDKTPVLVTVFGSVHGAVFVIFGLLTLQMWQRQRWNHPVTLLGCLSTIPPFCSILFEVWAVRTGRLTPAALASTPTQLQEATATAPARV